jgi:hypothetical protein
MIDWISFGVSIPYPTVTTLLCYWIISNLVVQGLVINAALFEMNHAIRRGLTPWWFHIAAPLLMPWVVYSYWAECGRK